MTDFPMRRGPYDQLGYPELQKVSEWEKDKEAQKLFQAQFREFIETRPLYSRFKLTLPPGRIQFYIDVARLYCNHCRTIQPFRKPEVAQWIHAIDKNLRVSEKQVMRQWDLLMNCVYPVELHCTECKQGFYDFFVHVDVSNGYVMKFGQMPMWTPQIDKELREALGRSTSFYLKALQNLNMSYGIGACAYFRRMVEDYINPLLTLLYDFKKDAGASQEELDEIQKVISSHVFSTKTAYAAQICPPTLIVAGMNPIKQIHELLSIDIHTGTDAEATETALKLKGAIEFTVKALRKQHDEQKQFIEAMKGIQPGAQK